MKRYTFQPRLQPPWLFIWTHPKDTLHEILVTNPALDVTRLAVLSGITRAIDTASGDDWTDLGTLLVRCLVIGVIGGIFALYAGGLLFQWSGRLFGGKASSQYVRTALAWSSIPDVALLILYIPVIVLNYTTKGVSSVFSCFYFLMFFGRMGLWVWRVLLLILCLARAHSFSIWRGLGTLLVGALVVGGLLLGLIITARAFH